MWRDGSFIWETHAGRASNFDDDLEISTSTRLSQFMTMRRGGRHQKESVKSAKSRNGHVWALRGR